MNLNAESTDSRNVLLAKWCKTLSDRKGNQNPPRSADSDNDLLRKILSLFRN